MAKPNFDTLLDLVERSGLVEKDALGRFLAAHRDTVQARDVDALAEAMIADSLVTRWQADRLLEGRYKGFFLKRYRLLDHLGRGGMSTVYLAEHVLMQRRVAIKVLPKDRVEDTSYLARFHREAQAAAALDHRNIVRAYDVDNDGSIHFLVMEYVEGRDLAHLVKQKGPLDFGVAADYIRQAAEGLAHAHQAGLIHRDVKPANLLVDQKNVVKLLDLGLARFADEERASLTVTYDENVLGTADYLAPEQAIDSHGVDSRADIYSLGCAFYFLLTGHAPFAEGTLPQRLMAHQKSQPPSIRIDRPDAPQDLLEIVAKMMAKKPAQRYQSAEEVGLAIGRWMNAHGYQPVAERTDSSARVLSASDSGHGLPPVRQGTKPLPPVRRGLGDSSASGSFRRPDESGSASGSRGRGLLTDTVASFEGDTLKGKKPAIRAKDSSVASKSSPRNLAPAKRQADDSESDFVLDIPVRSHSHGHDKGQSLTLREMATGQHGRHGPKAPPWIWFAIGGGFLLTLVLFYFVLKLS